MDFSVVTQTVASRQARGSVAATKCTLPRSRKIRNRSRLRAAVAVAVAVAGRMSK